MNADRKWLNITEYALLVGSGLGTVASIASQQFLLTATAAPMSALFLMNLMNRRRWESLNQTAANQAIARVNQKLTGEIASLQTQVQAVPSYMDLASLRKSMVGAQRTALATVMDDLAKLKQELTRPEWRTLPKEVQQLREHYGTLAESVNSVTLQLNRLNNSHPALEMERSIAQLRSELSQMNQMVQTLSDEQRIVAPRLQDQIDHLNRRFGKLPMPFDGTALQQDVDSLMQVMGEMVSRRELSRLAMHVEQLSHDNADLEKLVTPLRTTTHLMKKQLDTVAARVGLFEGIAPIAPDSSTGQSSVLDELRRTVHSLEQRFAQLEVEGGDVSSAIAPHLDPLQQQLLDVQKITQELDTQQQHLQLIVNNLPSVLDAAALQSQLRQLDARLNETEQQQDTLNTVMTTVQQAVQAQPESSVMVDVPMMVGLEATRSPSNRAMLLQGLTTAQARAILVCPWPTADVFDAELVDQMRAFLERGGLLDVGWGHLGDGSNCHTSRSIHQRRSLDPEIGGFVYDLLNQLMDLKRQYPQQFLFKILGTDEHFVVCDRDRAFVGMQSISLASVVFPEAQLGIQTTNTTVIEGLIDRFENPILDDGNISGYFHRALTRYDLGEKDGAIEDFNHILTMNEYDDIAYNNRALIRYDLGDKEGALADLSRAVECNAGNFVAYCNRGVIRSEIGDKMSAIDDFSCALQIDPDYSIAYFYRGLTRTRMQNKLGAIQDYSEVIRLDPQDASAYFYRGLACMKLGHRMSAIGDLRHAAQLFSEKGDLTSYQQAIQTIQRLHKSMAAEEGEAMVNEAIANEAIINEPIDSPDEN